MFVARVLLTATASAVTKTVTLNDGTVMPSVNLGTCCGSDPKVGLLPWLNAARPVMGAAPVGIDTAWDCECYPTLARSLLPPPPSPER